MNTTFQSNLCRIGREKDFTIEKAILVLEAKNGRKESTTDNSSYSE